MKFPIRSLFALSILAASVSPSVAEDGEWLTSTSLIGESKYANEFNHYDYVNPNAPKGGTLNSAALGTFDSFNPFIPKGDPGAGLNYQGGILWDTLMDKSTDEPSGSHPLIANAYKHPADYSSATYRLDPRAKWHDGVRISPEDVKWSMETLKRESAQYNRYFANVSSVEILNDHEVKFVFDQKGNRELPLIMGDLPVLPKHWWEAKGEDGEPRDFTRSTLEPPLGSGPYKITSYKAGSTITFERVKDYWAAETPTRKGRYNFDKIVYRYFGDRNAVWQAFQKGGLADVRSENRARRWQQDYKFPAFKAGDVKRKLFDETSGYSMVGWVFNQRRDMFKDVRLRKALTLALNFEQMNETLFFNQYKRINTYFGGTELSATGMPEGAELEILEKYRGKISNDVFKTPFKLPVYESRRDERKFLREALSLLNEAGWVRKGTSLVNKESGEPLKFEILGFDPNGERIHSPWMASLKKLGIETSFRVVDTSQYIQRINNFDFDVVVAGATQSLSPGNEQREYWSSGAADQPGSRNWYGLKDPVVDELVESLIVAKDRAELVATTKALDRILLSKYLWVQQWYLDKSRIAWWDKFGIPEKQPGQLGYDQFSWWIDTEKEAALAEKY